VVQQEATVVPQHLRMCLDPGLVALVGDVSAAAIDCCDRTGSSLSILEAADLHGKPSSSTEEQAALHSSLVGAVQEAATAAKGIVWTRKGLVDDGGHEDSIVDILGVAAADGDGCSCMSDSEASTAALEVEMDARWEERLVSDPQQVVELLLNCSAVVGMHADQATEPIVDLAIQLGRPFAVVPCCVYGSYFPGRKMGSGEPVTNYSQFVEYLLAKSPACASAELPFEGRNTVVFSHASGSRSQAQGRGALESQP